MIHFGLWKVDDVDVVWIVGVDNSSFFLGGKDHFHLCTFLHVPCSDMVTLWSRYSFCLDE